MTTRQLSNRWWYHLQSTHIYQKVSPQQHPIKTLTYPHPQEYHSSMTPVTVRNPVNELLRLYNKRFQPIFLQRLYYYFHVFMKYPYPFSLPTQSVVTRLQLSEDTAEEDVNPYTDTHLFFSLLSFPVHHHIILVKIAPVYFHILSTITIF